MQAYIQNVPNARTANGSYNPNQNWEQDIASYFGFVFQNNYCFFGFNQTLARAPVVRVRTAVDPLDKRGTVTLERNNTFNIGDFVRVIDSRTVLRGHYRGNPNGYHVSNSVGLTVTVDNWDNGDCDGGSMTVMEKVLLSPFLDDRGKQSPLVCTRKVGKPFFQFRGRASNRA